MAATSCTVWLELLCEQHIDNMARTSQSFFCVAALPLEVFQKDLSTFTNDSAVLMLHHFDKQFAIDDVKCF